MSNELVVTEMTEMTAEKSGRILYKNNENYQNLALFMEHPEFRKFYDTYVKDPLSLQTMLMFMKVYDSVEKKLPQDSTPFQKIAIVHEIFSRPKLRQKAVKGIMAWLEMQSNDSLLLSNNTSRKYIESNTDSRHLLEH